MSPAADELSDMPEAVYQHLVERSRSVSATTALPANEMRERAREVRRRRVDKAFAPFLRAG
jgi:hypothetical protein